MDERSGVVWEPDGCVKWDVPSYYECMLQKNSCENVGICWCDFE
jgi:hypothetical protein